MRAHTHASGKGSCLFVGSRSPGRPQASPYSQGPSPGKPGGCLLPGDAVQALGPLPGAQGPLSLWLLARPWSQSHREQGAGSWVPEGCGAALFVPSSPVRPFFLLLSLPPAPPQPALSLSSQGPHCRGTWGQVPSMGSCVSFLWLLWFQTRAVSSAVILERESETAGQAGLVLPEAPATAGSPWSPLASGCIADLCLGAHVAFTPVCQSPNAPLPMTQSLG